MNDGPRTANGQRVSDTYYCCGDMLTVMQKETRG